MDLLHEITHCLNIQQWYASPQNSNSCSKIISIQGSKSLSNHQVPEPWSGDLEPEALNDTTVERFPQSPQRRLYLLCAETPRFPPESPPRREDWQN